MEKEIIKDKEVEEVKETEQVEETNENEQKETAIDYEKINKILDGRQDGVLKGYFKSLGMSPEEVQSAVDSFKKQRAESTAKYGEMQNEVSQANERVMEADKRVMEAEMKSEALLMSAELGVDVKAMSVVIRMLRPEDVTSNGAVDTDKLKESLEEIISAIPSLKQTTKKGGFQVVGVETQQKNEADDDELYRIFGVSKK